MSYPDADMDSVGNKSVPIQLAQCRFPGLAIFNAKILIYFWIYQNTDCSFRKKNYCVIYYNFWHTSILRRVDLGSLSEIVRQRRLRFAGHILRLLENRPAYMAMNWQPDNSRCRRGRPTGGQHSVRTYMIWDLHGWVQGDLPATDRNGESSSPDVPAGTGGTKV